MSTLNIHQNKHCKRYARRKGHSGQRTCQGMRVDKNGEQFLRTGVPAGYWKDEGNGFHSDMSEKARKRHKALLRWAGRDV